MSSALPAWIWAYLHTESYNIVLRNQMSLPFYTVIKSQLTTNQNAKFELSAHHWILNEMQCFPALHVATYFVASLERWSNICQKSLENETGKSRWGTPGLRSVCQSVSAAYVLGLFCDEFSVYLDVHVCERVSLTQPGGCACPCWLGWLVPTGWAIQSPGSSEAERSSSPVDKDTVGSFSICFIKSSH